jgi:hypothetical protein
MFDPTFVPPEPSWSLVDHRPNCLPRKKLAKSAQKLFFTKALVSKIATMSAPQKNMTFCHVFTT